MSDLSERALKLITSCSQGMCNAKKSSNLLQRTLKVMTKFTEGICRAADRFQTASKVTKIDREVCTRYMQSRKEL